MVKNTKVICPICGKSNHYTTTSDKLEEYYDLKAKQKAQKIFHREQALRLRRELHNDYKTKHKKMFLFMDILFIVAIVFNLGALTITDMLVTKQNPTTQFVEGNAVQAQLHGALFDTQHMMSYLGAMGEVMIYVCVLGGYIWYRRYTYSELTFIIMFITIATLWFILGYDFFHDFGLLIGRTLV